MNPISKIATKTSPGMKRKFLSTDLPFNNDRLRQKRGLSLIDSNILANSFQIAKNDDNKESSIHLSQGKPVIEPQTFSRTKEELSKIQEIKDTVLNTKEKLIQQLNAISMIEKNQGNRRRSRNQSLDIRESFFLKDNEIERNKELRTLSISDEYQAPRKVSLICVKSKKTIPNFTSQNLSTTITMNKSEESESDSIIPLMKMEECTLNESKKTTEEILNINNDVNITITESSYESPKKEQLRNVAISHVESLNFIQTEKKIEALIKHNKELEYSLALANDNYASIQNSMRELLSELHKSESFRIILHNHIQKLRGNIRIYCRVKPQFELEAESSVQYPELSLTSTATNELTVIDLKEQSYHFDRVFPQASSQEDIFREVKPFLQSALDGDNVCIFAYGATGTGKTYTMQGQFFNFSEITECSGVLPRAADFILKEFNRKIRIDSIGKVNTAFIEFSACEVYNENIYDLLNKGISLSIVNNTVKGISSYRVQSTSDIINYCSLASKSRRSASTKFNESSSRSHAVYMIRMNIDGNQTKLNSVINIVDLAGSEKCSIESSFGKTQREIEKMKKLQSEAGFINKSLTALGRVISMLGDKKSNKAVIPYRDSKLTMLLRNSLTASSKNVVIVNISAETKDISQTKESLNFAANALFAL